MIIIIFIVDIDNCSLACLAAVREAAGAPDSDRQQWSQLLQLPYDIFVVVCAITSGGHYRHHTVKARAFRVVYFIRVLLFTGPCQRSSYSALGPDVAPRPLCRSGHTCDTSRIFQTRPCYTAGMCFMRLDAGFVVLSATVCQRSLRVK